MRMRVVRLAAIAAVLAIALSGCSFVKGFEKGVSTGLSALGTPKAGECWTGQYDTVRNWPTWQGSAPVSCSKAHQIYTYGVGRLKGFTAKSWEGPNGDVTPQIAEAAHAACAEQRKTFVPAYDEYEGRLDFAFYVPSDSKWAQGQRWVRCDVSEYAYGSSYRNPTFANLPGSIETLRSEDIHQSQALDTCTDVMHTKAQNTPLDSSATFADCTDDPDWSLVAFIQLPGSEKADAPYPGTKKANQVGEQFCLDKWDDTHDYAYYYYPTEQGWADGDREIKCWDQTF